MRHAAEDADPRAILGPKVPWALAFAISLDAAVVVCSTFVVTDVLSPPAAIREFVFRSAGQVLPLLTTVASIQFSRIREVPLRDRILVVVFLIVANLLAWLGAGWAMTENITYYA